MGKSERVKKIQLEEPRVRKVERREWTKIRHPNSVYMCTCSKSLKWFLKTSNKTKDAISVDLLLII